MVTKEAIKRLLSQKFKPSMLKAIARIKSLGQENISIEEVLKLAEENREYIHENNLEEKHSGKNYNKELDNSNFEPRNLSSILVLNKIDLVENKRKLRLLQEELEDLGAFDKVFHVSCETDYGIEALKNYLESKASRRPWRYHPDISCTQTEVDKAEQVLKRLVYNRFYKEIPYNIIGYVISWVPMSNGQLKINFNIEVKYDVHISIVIGKESRVIKELREELDKELASLMQKPVRSNLFVVQRKKMQQELLNEKGIITF